MLYILQTGFTMCGFVYKIFICLQSHLFFCLHFDVHFHLCSLVSHSALITYDFCLWVISRSQLFENHQWAPQWAPEDRLVALCIGHLYPCFPCSLVHLIALATILPCSLCCLVHFVQCCSLKVKSAVWASALSPREQTQVNWTADVRLIRY